MEISAYDSPASFAGAADRRETSRFPVREEVRYRVLHAKGLATSGIGKTLDIGSGGILFTTEEKLPMGRLVEVAVNWPVRLDGSCPLQFVAVGKVVRSEASQAAVQISRYEFKTRGTSGVAASAAD
ncbi:MAG TPA: PilZ domain-containing protein [Bryobacteraceae bacterium]|nr:PilZ domain-containing protein [Bryobacteraceae bacterium]